MELQNTWTLWYTEQDLDKYNWKLSNYKKLATIKTVQDFWKAIVSVPEHRWIDGMYFLMKDDILPTWESADNKNGQSMNFRVPKIYAFVSWVELAMQLVGENLMPSTKWNINGISISPKNNTVTIKIWTRDKSVKDVSEIPTILDFINSENVLLRPYYN